MGIKSLLKGEISLNELLYEYNATINYIKLPEQIDGCVFLYMGFYVIFIEKYLSDSKKRYAILHELAHIELNQLCQIDNDLFRFKIQQYEDEADEYLEDMLKKKK